jgi:putative membrane protein
MGEWGGLGYGAFNMIFWIIALVLIAALVAWFFRSGADSGVLAGRSARRSPALDVLEERYARGEINREEYQQKKRDIEG